MRSHADHRRRGSGRARGARAAGVGIAAAGGLLIAVAGAGGQTTVKPATATDPRADVRGGPDLVRVSLSRSSDGRLRAALTLAVAFEPSDLVAESGPPGSLCVKLWTTATPPDEPADHLVCATSDRSGRRLRGSVLRDRANRLPERVAAATVSRSSRRTVVLRFTQSSVGRPARVRMAGESTRPGCLRATCVDLAPDAPRTRVLRLRSS